MNVAEIKTIIRNNRKEIKRFGVRKIGVFGSCVREEAREDSDIDFLVVFKKGKKTFDNFMDLHEYLESVYHRKIDLVTPESVSKYIRPYIDKEAVYEKL
ncbi:MAG: nucleotidyltransferase family protein [Spirochaetes bacterium]|nr:nucleotidyltransferase family protein [Spirochaetota bacterium]